MIRLLDAVSAHETVFVSRLADEESLSMLRSAGTHMIEVPHIACVPVIRPEDPATTRVRYWPNLGGYLEAGNPGDVVVWFSSLAQAPDDGIVVESGPPPRDDVKKRTEYFVRLIRRIEQHRGVSRACTPRSARGIVYTPGVPAGAIKDLAKDFPDACSRVPKRLAEFPGGISITMTDHAWHHAERFAKRLDGLLSADAETSTRKDGDST